MNSKNLWILIISVSSVFLMGVAACQNQGTAPEDQWHPKIYVGDSKTQSFVRKENALVEEVKCSDPLFDQSIVMNISEIAAERQAYFDVINQCDIWKSAAAKTKAEASGWELWRLEMLLKQDMKKE